MGAATAAEDDWEPRVARVAWTEGDVSYLNADAEEWAPVEINAPLVTGDRFYSGPGAKAELELPGGIHARVDEETELDLLELSDRAVHVRVGLGTATFRVRDVPVGHHVELSTPATAVVARTRGVYRVDVEADGVTTVLVRDGEVDAYLGEDRYRLGENRGARFVAYGEGDDEYEPVEVFDASYVEPDRWDQWESERAARVRNAVSYQYVDDDVYGVADLDHYGDWQRHEEYGPIWRPRQVASGWAPFSNGRWVWQDPWGWTWVDYEPWGWAPSHYGRWVYVQDYWAWAPGPVVARPVYAPATVGFLGVSVNTPSLSVSIGIGSGPSVGWVPLGWGEPILPWWRGVGGVVPGRPWWGGWGGPRVVNNTIIKETNITNIDVTNIRYANLERPRGFTAVERDAFVRGDLRRLDLPHDRIREIARPLRGAPEIVPQRESLFATRPAKLREGRRVEPPREALQRAAVTTRAVPASRPAFESKRPLIEQAKGQPVEPRELRRLARAEDGKRSQVQTVAARGQRVVRPAITAEAPKQARGPIERRASAQRGMSERESRTATVPRRETGADRDVSRDGAQAARGGAQGAPTERARARSTTRERGTRDGQSDRPGSVTAERRQPDSTQRRQALDTPERGAPSARASRPDADTREAARTSPNARTASDARTSSAERGRADREAARTRSESAAREQRAAVERDRAQSERRQREQAERTRAEQAARTRNQQAERTRVERAQREQAQRQQTERAQREQAQRQQTERAQTQRREQEAVERQQREQVERQQRQQAERRQRDAAARQQREQQQRERTRVESQQRQQAERAQVERRQREQAQRTQAERAQRERAQREQAQRAQAQRAQAERTQRERAQREQAQRAQAERTQREQAQRAQAQRAQREQAQRAQQQRAQAERARREQAQRAQQQRTQAQRAQREQAQRAQAQRNQREQTRRAPDNDDDPRAASRARQSPRRQSRSGT